MKLLLLIVRTYPQRTLLTLVCLVLAGIAEGIGITSLLPVIRLAARDPATAAAGDTTTLERGLTSALGGVGLHPTSATLFTIVLCGIALKAVLLLLANRQVGYAVAHVATSLRLQLIRALLGTRWSYFVHKPVGAIANSVAMEAQAAADAYMHGTTVLALLVQCLVFAAISCLVSWQATLGALADRGADHGRAESPGALVAEVRTAPDAGHPRAARAAHRHAPGREAVESDGARAAHRARPRRRDQAAEPGARARGHESRRTSKRCRIP